MEAILPVLLCIGAIVLVGSSLLLFTGIRVVPEYNRLVVFRLGRALGQRGPGLVILIPLIDVARAVDVREQMREISKQRVITKDKKPVLVDWRWRYKVLDPVRSVISVENVEAAAGGIGNTVLRSTLGEMVSADVLSDPAYTEGTLGQTLRAKLDEVTEGWGVKVTNVEIREIRRE